MASAGQRTLRAAKQIVRKELRSTISKMTADEKAKQSLNVMKQLLDMEVYKTSTSISLYLSMPSEVNTNDVLCDVFSNKKKCYIPHYVGDDMKMVRLRDQNDYDNLPVTSWNIKQPADDDFTRPCALDEGGLDIIIVPGLGFTNHGLRLGRGKGYYDNYFRKYKEKFNKLPLLVGLAFDCQIKDDLPADEFDINLDIVISPQKN